MKPKNKILVAKKDLKKTIIALSIPNTVKHRSHACLVHGAEPGARWNVGGWLLTAISGCNNVQQTHKTTTNAGDKSQIVKIPSVITDWSNRPAGLGWTSHKIQERPILLSYTLVFYVNHLNYFYIFMNL